MRTRDQREGGGATINAQFCPFCGKPRPDPSAVFCAYCGRAIAATPGPASIGAAPGAPPPPPAPQFRPPAGMVAPPPPPYSPPQYAIPQHGQYAVPPAGMPQPAPMVYAALPGALPFATRKSAGIAVLLETLLPGIGELYLGRVGMGLAWLLGTPAVFGVLYFWLRFQVRTFEQFWSTLIAFSLVWYATRVALAIGDARVHNLRIPGLPQPVGTPSGQPVAIPIVVVLLAPLITFIAFQLVGGLVITGMVGAAFWLALQRLPYAQRGRVWGEVVLFSLAIFLVSALLELAYVKQIIVDDSAAYSEYLTYVSRQLPAAAFVFVLGASLAFALAVLRVRWPTSRAAPDTAEVLRNFPLAALCLVPELPLFIFHSYLDAHFNGPIPYVFYPVWPIVLNVVILIVFVVVGAVMTARRFKSTTMAR